MVTIVCLCYNQEDFVCEALASVFGQTYDNIQIIIIDNGSSDNSVTHIRKCLKEHDRTDIPTLFFKENKGNCRAFNEGLLLAEGRYIIDFSCDDVMLPQKIEQQVQFFDRIPDDTAMIYSNTDYIDEQGRYLSTHFSETSRWKPHSGDVYTRIIAEYFIPTPTMMFRTDILKSVGGYDDSLSYEDFDIWVRLARNYKIRYQDEVLMQTRRSKSSMSGGWYRHGDLQAYSTYRVCLKIEDLNQTEEEDEALMSRLLFELRQCFKHRLKKEFRLNYQLLKRVGTPPLAYRVMSRLI